MTRQPLTPRQAQIWRTIIRFFARTGYWPTFRDVMKEVKIASPNGVKTQFIALEKKGWLVPFREDTVTVRRFIVPGLSEALKQTAARWLAEQSPTHPIGA